MGNLTQVVGVIGAIISVCLAIGAGIALVRGSYNRARMDALRQDNADLRVRQDDTHKELVDCQNKLALAEGRITHLEQEKELLTALVTQRAEFEKVLDALNNHHERAEETWAALAAAMMQVAARLDKMEDGR